jgi:tetratricopeptide (TPR) repeat protein
VNDPREISDLYQKGVEYYARGEYLEASAMFLRILQIDPQNEPARKALERIESRQSEQ